MVTRRKAFYKRPLFVGLSAALGIFASVGAGWPFVTWLVGNHDAYVSLQNTVNENSYEIGCLWAVTYKQPCSPRQTH